MYFVGVFEIQIKSIPQNTQKKYENKATNIVVKATICVVTAVKIPVESSVV